MYKIEDKIVEYSWDNATLFDAVSYNTGIKARNIDVEDDGDIMDYILSESNVEYFISSLEKTITNLYEYFRGVVPGELCGVYVSKPSGDDELLTSGFAISCHRDGSGQLVSNESHYAQVDRLSKDYLILSIVSSWCEDNRLKDYKSSVDDSLLGVIENLKKNISLIKRRSSSSSFS